MSEFGAQPRAPRWLVGVFAALLVSLVVACGGTAESPLPSQSLALYSPSPPPSAGSSASGIPTPTATGTGSWPPGWDVAFCAMFDNAVDAQQLIVDIERAIGSGAQRDAKGLARNMHDSATQATQLLAQVPQWNVGSDAVTEIGKLMDYATRAADNYTKYFTKGTSAALRQARALRRQDAADAPKANQDLAKLTESGLACPNNGLQLESP